MAVQTLSVTSTPAEVTGLDDNNSYFVYNLSSNGIYVTQLDEATTPDRTANAFPVDGREAFRLSPVDGEKIWVWTRYPDESASIIYNPI